VALLRRLETDRSLAVFAGQFVPLKLTTDGNPEWSSWARKYPLQGNGIPRLYVVRADGEKLYGGIGAPPGNQLTQMLYATLQKAGRRYTPDEVALLKSSVKEAKAAFEKDDHPGAALALSRLNKLGELGQLGSFATPALAADELAKKLIGSSERMVDDAVKALQNSDSDGLFPAALTLADAKWRYSGFPAVQAKLTSAITQVKRDERATAPLAQAEALVRARRLAASDRAAVRKQAFASYETVMRRYPGTEADKLARAELAKLSPNAALLLSPDDAKPRVWKDASGRFSVEATLIRFDDKTITLKKTNGQEITLPVSKLSEPDQEFLKRKNEE